MKNLVAELDILEAQLSQIKEQERSSKFYKTKFIVEKAKQPKDVENLESKVQSLKQELANRKLHHCIKQLGRFVKTFKQLEPLKLKKRLKATPAKATALAAEMEIVKELNVEEWAEYIARAQLFKVFGSALPFEKRQMAPAENNIYGRICRSAQVKDSVDATVKAISQWFHVEDSKTATPLESAKAPASAGKDEAKRTGTDASKHDSKATVKDTKLKESARATEVSKEESKKEPKSSKREKQDDFVSLPDVSMDDDGNLEPDEAIEDDFFVATDGGALPELTNGYISGSDDDDDEPEQIKPERRNRRGQRARRAIWEAKYGSRAKHKVKEREDMQKQFLEKQRKREFRIQKDEQRRLAHKARDDRKKEIEEKPLHPSWAARLEQEKKLAAKPRGKKIVFD